MVQGFGVSRQLFPHFRKFRCNLFSHFLPNRQTKLNTGVSGGSTTAVANDGMVRRVDQRGCVDCWKSTVNQLKLILAKQRRPDRLDLDVGKCLADAPVSTGAERNVAELLLAQSSLVVQESANVHHLADK